MTRRRLHELTLWAAFVVAIAAFLVTTPAQASHGTEVCAGSLDYSLCIALIDEVELQAEEGRAQVESGVPLDEADENRLELAWWGQWALVGLLLAGFTWIGFARLMGARS